ncbi:MAG: NUDIX hydrolase [Polyangiales bacterium]|nr:NUDIX hydrolase [Myxococcales bacterium]
MSVVDAAVDASYRVVFRVGHRVLRAWWRVRSPKTSGALAAVWYRGELLLVKNSYRRDHTLPGGYVHPGEDPRVAASRELFEETGLRVASDRFTHAYHGSHRYENRQDSLDIYEVTLDTLPDVRIDGREVVWAGFRAPADARAMRIVPHLEDYLAGR